jgi:hypothetical protein
MILRQLIVVTESTEKVAKTTVARLQCESGLPVCRFRASKCCEYDWDHRGIVVMTDTDLLEWSEKLTETICIPVLFVDECDRVSLFFESSLVVYNFVCRATSYDKMFRGKDTGGLAACGR